jgi:plastocyanin
MVTLIYSDITVLFYHHKNLLSMLRNATQDYSSKQIATSGDITPGSSSQVSVKPNMPGTFGYHCLYHPDTMKGIIQVH